MGTPSRVPADTPEAKAAVRQRQHLPPLRCAAVLLLQRGGLGALLSAFTAMCKTALLFCQGEKIFPGVLCSF